MSGIKPENLRRVVNASSQLAQPAPTGAADTTKSIAKDALKGAAKGGVAGAIRGAAVGFLKTSAGRKVLAVVAAIALLVAGGPPLMAVSITMAMTGTTSAGVNTLGGQSAMASGKTEDEVSEAMSITNGSGIPWQLYLALTGFQERDDIDLQKLHSALSKQGVNRIGAAGVIVSGVGYAQGSSDASKSIASRERDAFIAALTEYGLTKSKAKQVYEVALKWTYGEQADQCASTTGSAVAMETAATTEFELPDGKTQTLDERQVSNAQAIVKAASNIAGVNRDALIVAIMAALQESSLLNHANSNVPGSEDFPHDRVGSDHDSLGFWQMRVGSWGTVEQLMDIKYQTRAFFGGDDSPNGGSPAGLFDVKKGGKTWDQMTKGEAAQAVEVSKHPDKYDKWEPLATAVVDRYSSGVNFCGGGNIYTSGVAHPLGPDGENIKLTSPYGDRAAPCAGCPTNHRGIDFGAACNHPVYALAAGVVTFVGDQNGGWGTNVVIDHGEGFKTRYAHMPVSGPTVSVSDVVAAGDQIGVVGNTGMSSGCHLHFETLIDGVRVIPDPILAGMGITLNYVPGREPTGGRKAV